jgi:hypothetical protein
MVGRERGDCELGTFAYPDYLFTDGHLTKFSISENAANYEYQTSDRVITVKIKMKVNAELSAAPGTENNHNQSDKE